MSRPTAVALAAVVLIAGPAAAGQLARARDEVRNDPAPSGGGGALSDARGETRRSHSEHPNHHGAPKRRGRGPSRGSSSCGGVFWVSSPAPYCCDAPRRIDYHYYPIQAAPKRWFGRVDLGVGSAGDDVRRTSLGFLLENESGIGVDFDWDNYSEELAGGDHDELHLGQVNFMFRVISDENAVVRAGIGVGWLGDAYGTEAGLNLTVQGDLLLTRDWIASADVDLGTLGDAQTVHAAATLGRRFGCGELYGGYEYRRIGGVTLDGPTVGLRLSW